MQDKKAETEIKGVHCARPLSNLSCTNPAQNGMTQSFAQDEVVGGCHQDLDVLLGHFSICLELGRWVDAVRCSRFPFNGMKRDREIGGKV